jgi:LPS export ABC transporter protein LptC/lipopolysaccharide transport protein LptA
MGDALPWTRLSLGMNNRRIRLLLASLFVMVLGWTALTLRHPSPRIADLPSTGPKAQDNRVEKFVYRAFREGAESFVVTADRWEGSRQATMTFYNVTTNFSYSGDKKPGKGTVTADTCVYASESQKADYHGHVVLKTEDGLELHSESLLYRGDKQLAKTDDPFEFTYGRFGGSGTGMVYKASEGEIHLLAAAYVRANDEKGGPPTEVRSGEAVAAREDGTLIFRDNVVMTRDADTLKTDVMTLTFDTESRHLVSADANGQVELVRRAGSAPLPGLGASTGKGQRTLRCSKLVMTFRSDRTPESANAGGDAEFVTLPGPDEAQEKRVLKARALIFGFDDKGRVNELQGWKDVSFRAEPLPGAPRLPPRTGFCRSFVAAIDPEKGETKTAEFSKDVVFTRGAQKASAQHASYDGDGQVLHMRITPELEDAEEGTSLTADTIDLSLKTGDINAFHLVKNVLRPKQGKKGPEKGAPKASQPKTARDEKKGKGEDRNDEEPAVLLCDRLEQTARTKTTLCTGSAFLRRGKTDEIRAPKIILSEDAQGRQHLRAEPEVATQMLPEAKPGQKAKEVVEGRSKLLVYEESRGQIVYTGDVHIKQGNLSSVSPEATVTLNSDGSAVRSILAGEPVTVTQVDDTGQKPRTGTGTRATYDPMVGTVFVEGRNVVLKDGPQVIQGRTLTFHSADGRALMSGEGEARTESVFGRPGAGPSPQAQAPGAVAQPGPGTAGPRPSGGGPPPGAPPGPAAPALAPNPAAPPSPAPGASPGSSSP